METFASLCEWYHYALLSLVRIPGTKLEPKWIAKRLAISEIEAKLAIENLKRLHIVKKVNGQWKRVKASIGFDNNRSTSDTRRLHSQLLRKAIESLNEDSLEIRDHSSITIAIDPSQIPFAREQIIKFRRKLSVELESRGKPKEVYNLTVQIYPVSKKGEKE